MMKRMGTSGVLCFACFCYMIRFLSYASLYNPQHVLWIEPLHGITYAVMWSTSCNFAHKIAPPGLGASTQGLLSGIHWGLGQGLGGLVAGAIYQHFGPRQLFVGAASAAALALSLMAYDLKLARRERDRAQAEEDRVRFRMSNPTIRHHQADHAHELLLPRDGEEAPS